jgi:hypothetical protein
MIIGFIGDQVQHRHQDFHKDEMQDVRKNGGFRTLFEKIKMGHLWFSLLFIPFLSRNFSRPRRITVLYCLILGTLTTNALFYGVNQKTPIQTVSASVISSLISLPFPLLITFIFEKIAGMSLKKKKKEVQEENHEMEDVTEKKYDKVATLTLKESMIVAPTKKSIPFEPKVTEEKNSEDIIKNIDNMTKGIDDLLKINEEELYEEEEHNLSNNDFLSSFSFKKKKESIPFFKEQPNPKIIESAPEEVISNPVEKEVSPSTTHKRKSLFSSTPESPLHDGETHKEIEKSTMEKEIEIVKQRIETRKILMSRYKYGATINSTVEYVMDKLDHYVETATVFVGQNKFMNSLFSCSFLFFLLMFIFFVIYFAILAGVLAILYTFDFWKDLFTTIVICGSLIAQFGIVLILYLLGKQRKRKLMSENDKDQKISIKIILVIFLVLLIVLLILLFIGQIFVGIFSPILTWNIASNAPHHTVIGVTFLLLIGICVIGIFLVLIPMKAQKKKKDSKRSKGWPWWFILFVYPIIWVYILALSFVLMIYGIYFGQERANAWLKAALFGIGLDIIGTKPITLLLKIIGIALVISLVEIIF